MFDDSTRDMYEDTIGECCCKCLIGFGIFILFATLWSVTVAVLIAFFEIMLFLWIPYAFYYYNEGRFSHSQTFMKLFNWLYQSKSRQDTILRLIAINFRLSHPKVMNDEHLHLFLKNIIKLDLGTNYRSQKTINSTNDIDNNHNEHETTLNPTNDDNDTKTNHENDTNSIENSADAGHNNNNRSNNYLDSQQTKNSNNNNFNNNKNHIDSNTSSSNNIDSNEKITITNKIK